MKRKTSKQYTETFRKEAVNLVLEQGYTVPQAAKALDIPTKLLYSWRKRYEKEGLPGALTLTERQELLALRKENKLLKMEKEILKKASAFFAKELL
ncbi:IS3 family transposase [Providencia manganoxydans]|uniref:Transposase n=1 Tax=Providencia stuartii TaxID=588 RepID=A0A1S1HM34_PROST|nr:IS3 family transposase [Providencia rettgeri]OHT23389.1 transposase [Providencia stuartii]